MNSQQSLKDQIQQLIVLANKHGLYDAADFVKTFLIKQEDLKKLVKVKK